MSLFIMHFITISLWILTQLRNIVIGQIAKSITTFSQQSIASVDLDTKKVIIDLSENENDESDSNSNDNDDEKTNKNKKQKEISSTASNVVFKQKKYVCFNVLGKQLCCNPGTLCVFGVSIYIVTRTSGAVE